MQKIFQIWLTVLNKWKIKIQLLKFNFEYPIGIIPNQRYKIEINIDELINDKQKVTLVRRSDKSIDDTFDEIGHLRENAILPEDVPDLSTNMLGSFFKKHHIKYRILKPAYKNWEGEEIILSEYLNCFEVIENNIPIYFKVYTLHKKYFPISIEKKSEKAKRYLKYLKRDLNKEPDIARFYASLEVKHSPNKLNYWHVEILLLDPEKKRIKKAEEGTNKRTAEFALIELICYNGKRNLEYMPDKIVKKYYFK